MATASASATYQPENLDRWTAKDPAFSGSNNYAGADFSAFYVAPVGRNRDNEDVPRIACNWKIVTAEIEEASEHEGTGACSFGHWACGWYELYLIHESDTKALEVADSWACTLADYPIADDGLLSELEMEDQQRTYDNCLRDEWQERVRVAVFEALAKDYDEETAEEIQENITEREGAEEVMDSAFWESSIDDWYDSGDGQWCRVDDLSTVLAVSRLLFPVNPDQQLLALS
jgi:hypothetical protein